MMENLSGFPDVAGWTGPNFQAHRGPWTDYMWLVILGAFAAFMAAWGIGANDVANSFATSVGAKSVTMFQACIIAGIFEFVGAVALGGSVTKTIKGSITDPAMFAQEPQIFAYGMLCAAIAIGMTLFFATYMKMAVSTTHTAVGSVLGFGLVWGGADGVTWNEATDEFPFRKGFTPVVISWFLSPIFTAIVSSFIFFWTRLLVLRQKNSYRIAFWTLPPLVMVTIFVVLLAIFLKAWVAIIVGIGCGILSTPYVFWLRSKMFREDQKINAATAERDTEMTLGVSGEGKEGLKLEAAIEMEKKEADKTIKWIERFKASWIGSRPFVRDFLEAMTYDVHAHVASLDDPRVARLHALAEVFDPRTEDVFKHLQVVTASAVAFVHGANDVANGVGPLAGIWGVYNTYKASSKAEQPRWILVLGAFGIVFGLAMYGYRIIATLGVDLVVMTPSRGYSAELAATVIIALASVYGLPISTTQTITGGEIGVGMLESWKMTGVNWVLFIRTFFGWIGALILGAILSAAMFSIGIYGPSRTNMDYVLRYQDAMRIESEENLGTLKANCAAATGPCINGMQYTMDDLIGLENNLKTIFDADASGEINQYNMMYIFRQISGLYQATFKP